MDDRRTRVHRNRLIVHAGVPDRRSVGCVNCEYALQSIEKDQCGPLADARVQYRARNLAANRVHPTFAPGRAVERDDPAPAVADEYRVFGHERPRPRLRREIAVRPCELELADVLARDRRVALEAVVFEVDAPAVGVELRQTRDRVARSGGDTLDREQRSDTRNPPREDRSRRSSLAPHRLGHARRAIDELHRSTSHRIRRVHAQRGPATVPSTRCGIASP